MATALSIRNLMFTFEDLVTIPPASMREIVAAADKRQLALALRGAQEDLRAHVFSAMSSRAADMLKEDMEVMGPVRAARWLERNTKFLPWRAIWKPKAK